MSLLLIIISAVATIQAPSTDKSTYILNTSSAEIISTENNILTDTDARLWLKSIYKTLPLPVQQTRADMIHKDGRSLESLINELTTALLSVDSTLADESFKLALELISEQPPYSSLSDDLIEMSALMAGREPEKILESNELPYFLAWQTDPRFLSRIPTKARDLLGTHSAQNLEIKKSPVSGERLFLQGSEIKFPLKLQTGRYFIQSLSNGILRNYWWTLSPNASSAQLVLERSIWSYTFRKDWTSIVFASKPKSVQTNYVQVVFVDKYKKISHIQYGSRDPSGATYNNYKNPFADIFKDPPEEETKTSILKSPWFWIGSAVVAGTVAYFAYDASHERVAKTP